MLILYAVAPIGRIFSYKNDTCICYNVTTVCKSSKQSGYCLYIYIYCHPIFLRMEGKKNTLHYITAQSYFRSFFLYTIFFLVQLSSCLYDILQTCCLIYGLFCDVRCHKLGKKGKII